jgi:hypothetical protein
VTEPQLRALVREAILRHVGGAPAGRVLQPSPGVVRPHASHGMFLLPTGTDADGPCLIEPAVACNHCGYCKSIGH